MAFSQEDIDSINRKALAVKDKIYTDLDGKQYIGLASGRLKYLPQILKQQLSDAQTSPKGLATEITLQEVSDTLKGVSTEETLVEIKNQTDKLNFTADLLKVTDIVNESEFKNLTKIENLLSSLIKQQAETNKLLRKIYNPE